MENYTLTTAQITKLYVKVVSDALALLEDRAGTKPIFEQRDASWSAFSTNLRGLLFLNEEHHRAKPVPEKRAAISQSLVPRGVYSAHAIYLSNHKLKIVLPQLAGLYAYEIRKKKDDPNFKGWSAFDLNRGESKPVLERQQYVFSPP